MKTASSQRVLSRAVCMFTSCVLALSLCAPAGAFAQEQAKSGTVECENGWVLDYTEQGGAVQIAGAATIGSGKLSIPDSVDGKTVTSIAEKAFYSEPEAASYKDLTQVDIPDTVRTLGTAAFMNTGLTSITLPAGIEYLPLACFANCQKLSQVDFECESMGYIAERVFSNCKSLKSMTIPVLTSRISASNNARVGSKCFDGCSALETVEFLGDAHTYTYEDEDDDGEVTTVTRRFVESIDVFNDCPALVNLVYHCSKSSMKKGTGSSYVIRDESTSGADDGTRLYLTMNFYASVDYGDAAPVYSITCRDSVKIRDIVAGTVDKGAIWCESGNRDALKLEDGKVWGLESKSALGDTDTLSDTRHAVPVAPDALGYGWLSSPTIETYRVAKAASGNQMSSFGAPGGSTLGNYPKYYIDDAGNVVGLDDIQVYAADGSLVDSDSYTLVYEEGYTSGSGNSAKRTWTKVDFPDEVGVYRVHAEGREGTASEGTATKKVEFEVSEFEPNLMTFQTSDAATRWAQASHVAAVSVKGKAKSAVVVPAGDWRCQLLGAALAGAGDGIVLVDNKANFSSAALNAYAESRVSAVQIVGSTSLVPESASASDEVYLADYLRGRSPEYWKRYGSASPQALADEAYTAIKKLSDPDSLNYGAFGDGWGETAIIASPAFNVDTQPVAQYAYAQKAPVFFTGSDGKLSNTDLGYLKSGGFERVIAAGDAGYVSEACLAQVKQACGLSPVRMFATGVNSLEACLGSVDELGTSASTTVICATRNVADITAGAALAAARGGIMLPCSTTADSKRIQEHLRSVLAKKGQASVASVYLVGDFSAVDPGLLERMEDMWEAPRSTAVGAGDTVEVGDYIYTIGSGSSAKFKSVRNTAMVSTAIGDIRYEGKTYKVGSVPVGLLATAPLLQSVTFTSGQASVDAGTFKGCSALTTVALGSKVTSIAANTFSQKGKLSSVSGAAVKSIGANAFKGCASLKSAALPKTATVGDGAFYGCKVLPAFAAQGVTGIGANAFYGCGSLASFSAPKAVQIGNSAFQSCSKLKQVSFASGSLRKIGSRAFYGCKKLKSLKFKSKKLSASKIGAKAFKGVASKAKVYVPKAKMKVYKKAFVKKGLSKKCKFKSA